MDTDENSARRITWAVITPCWMSSRLPIPQILTLITIPRHIWLHQRTPASQRPLPTVVFFSSGRDDVERSRSIRTMLASSRSAFVMHETARGLRGLQNETSGRAGTGISGPGHFLCNWRDISAWDGFRFLSFRKQPPSSAAKCCIRRCFHVCDCPFALSASGPICHPLRRHRTDIFVGAWSACMEELMTLDTTLWVRFMMRTMAHGLPTIQSCVVGDGGDWHVLERETARLSL
ncbi:hypothetical protein C8F01DRAFT_41683 [Mycena amicta]|nr:hypothetical protein C8F01DRAFT_41683 [Mycena amicta]